MGGPVLVDALRIPPVAISPHADLAETPRGWELNSTGLTLGGPTLSSLGPHDIPSAMGVLKSGKSLRSQVAVRGEGGGRLTGRREGQSGGGRCVAWYVYTGLTSSKCLSFLLSFQITCYFFVAWLSTQLIILVPLSVTPP